MASLSNEPALLSHLGTVAAFIIPPLLAALLSGYAVGRWKGRGDYLEKRLDDLCSLIDAAADVASDYWAVAQSDQSATTLEAKVRSQLMKIAGLRAVVQTNMSKSSGSELSVAESRFFREATGGDFGVHNREMDHSRQVAIRHTGAEYIIAIRRARMADHQGLRQRS